MPGWCSAKKMNNLWRFSLHRSFGDNHTVVVVINFLHPALLFE